MVQVPDLALSKQVYTEFKFWGPVVGAFWIVFKAYNWVLEIKTKDLCNIQDSIKEFNFELDRGLTKQTTEFVNSVSVNTNEIKELRGDIKMLTAAILNQNAKAARARKKQLT